MVLQPTPPSKCLPSTPSELTRNSRARKEVECSSVMECGPRKTRTPIVCPPHYAAPHPHKPSGAPRVHRIAPRHVSPLSGQTLLALRAKTLATSTEVWLLLVMYLIGAPDIRREA